MRRPAPASAGVPSRRRGYILVETIVAMALLSAGMVAIQGGLRQAVLVRGQARDYTQARFLMDGLIADLSLQPEHVQGSKSGRFSGEYDRFSYTWTISRVDVPVPQGLPPGLGS